MKTIPRLALVSVLCIGFANAALAAKTDRGFTKLFDGETLNGWKMMNKRGEGYTVKDGAIVCAKGGGGNLYTEKEYADFVLRFEFKLEPGANNGLGIRAPLEGDAAYVGMELQILDEWKLKYKGLRPEQFHGSIYDVLAAKRGALKQPGEWNTQEVTARGRQIKVVLNGKTILNEDLNKVTNVAVLQKHPGLFREKGHIGFLGHNDYVEFRNIRIKELSTKEKDNNSPKGFKSLFNGRNLKAWKGLMAGPHDNPIKRAALSSNDRGAKQKEADENMRAHWKVEDGALVFDGKGRSLCTDKDYANYELLVDWKIHPKGDSGIYLRGTPQVQIWDPALRNIGSGGLFNNQTNASKPLLTADKPVGEWNRFRILMLGQRVHVFLNGKLVVNNVALENYWDRSQPLLPTGPIELQNHGDTLWFKNIYIRELPERGSANRSTSGL